MSYNGSGVFNINTAGQPVVTGTVISSTAFNALTADLATGLTTALTKDGQTTPTANIKLGGFKLTGIGVATTSGDALSYGQAATISTLTNSALTSGRVTYATTAGLLTDSANLLYSGTDLTVYGLTVGRGGGAVSTNTAIGSSALAGANSGGSNTALGYQALQANTSGTGSIAIGYQAAYSGTTAAQNLAIGYQALYSNTATNVYGIGYQALYNNTGGDNYAYGYQSLYTNTSGSNNVAMGLYSLKFNTTGSNQSAFGDRALTANTTGTQNSAFGSNALVANTTGGNNTALGMQSLAANTTASNNTAVGYQALNANVTGTSCVALGYQALLNSTANSNVGIGAAAGSNATSGGNNIFIGAGSQANAATDSGELVIGTNAATGKGSSTGFISPNSGGVYQGNNGATWSVTSDQRLKKNIVDNNSGLDKILSIQVRNFEYRLPEEVDAELKPTDAIKKSGVQLGAIAQELQQILPDCVKTESTGVMSVQSDNLTWYLINAIKQLNAKVEALESQLNQGA